MKSDQKVANETIRTLSILDAIGERDELAFNQADVDFYDKSMASFRLLKSRPSIVINTEGDFDNTIIMPTNDAVEKARVSGSLAYEQLKKRTEVSPNDLFEIDSVPSFIRFGGRRVGRTFTNEIMEKLSSVEYMRYQMALHDLEHVTFRRLSKEYRHLETKPSESKLIWYVGTPLGSKDDIYMLHGIHSSISILQNVIDEIIN
jgi:hypothetical protein